MSDNIQPPEPTPGDDFDARARQAGEALRRPAPQDGLLAVQRARRRQQLARGGVAALAVVLLVGGGVWAFGRDDTHRQVRPAATTTTAPAPSTTGSSVLGSTPVTGPTTPGDTVASSTPVTVPPGQTTSLPQTSTTAACTFSGDTLSKSSTDPQLMSGMVGADVRVGNHPCFTRVVIELQGSGDMPGWTVEYQDDPQVLGESNETASLAGDATLHVRLGCWFTNPDGTGYTGSTDIFVTSVPVVQEMRMLEDFEGISRWGIGIDHQRPFKVTVLSNPARLVIDIDNS